MITVAVAHGDLETDADVDAVEELRQVALGFATPSRRLVTAGGNDWTAWTFDGPGASAAALELERAVRHRARPWWRVRIDTRPPSSAALGHLL